MPPAVLLHTADLHNRLSPAAAARLTALRQEQPGAILLDAGDAVAAGNLTWRSGGEPILRLMARLGYQAMAMGNRESHPSSRLLALKLRDAAFPVLAANLASRRGHPPEPVRAHLLLEGPPRVAVIGLAPQITPPGSRWARLADFVFEDPVATAARVAAELRPQAELVVVLSHCGLETDRLLAELPDVDLVLGGHSHRQVIEQQPPKATVVHPGWHGRLVSRTEIASRRQVTVELLPLGQDG